MSGWSCTPRFGAKRRGIIPPKMQLSFTVKRNSRRKGGTYMFAKRVWFVTAFTISLLMVAAPATRADSKNEAHEAIQRACARIDAAFNSKDINTLFSFFTSDFVLISEKG